MYILCIFIITQINCIYEYQIGIQYVIPRLKQVEEINDEMPTNFQIEIIDRLDKYKDRNLDKTITS